MIKKSKQPISVKGLMKTLNLILLLFLYLHWLACLWNLTIMQSSPIVYIVQRDDSYENQNGEKLVDEQGNQIGYFGLDFLVMRVPFYSETDWDRITEEDGVLGWKSYNLRWDQRPTQWNSPIDFSSYTE